MTNPSMQKLQTLLTAVEKEFHDGLKDRGLTINEKPRTPVSEITDRSLLAFNALQESGGRITQDNVHLIVPTIFYADRSTTVQLIPDYLRALLSLASEHPDDLAVIDNVRRSMSTLSRAFGELLHGENRDEIAQGKPSIAIRLKNAKIYKTYMTLGMRKALKAYLVAWFEFFTQTYSAKLNLRRQWFHNSWL